MNEELKPCPSCNGRNIKAVIDIAIEAIEKQIPKKPIDDSYPWVTCPTCSGSVFTEHIREHIQNEETTYCEHCGQAIDWRTTE